MTKKACQYNGCKIIMFEPSQIIFVDAHGDVKTHDYCAEHFDLVRGKIIMHL